MRRWGIRLTALGLFPHHQDESQPKGTQRRHHKQVGLRPTPLVDLPIASAGPSTVLAVPSAGAGPPSLSPRRRKDDKRRREKEQSLAPWVTVTQEKGVSATSPRPRFLGSWTKNWAHLRPDSRAGTSPSLCASAAILVSKLLSPPPTLAPPSCLWIG